MLSHPPKRSNRPREFDIRRGSVFVSSFMGRPVLPLWPLNNDPLRRKFFTPSLSLREPRRSIIRKIEAPNDLEGQGASREERKLHPEELIQRVDEVKISAPP